MKIFSCTGGSIVLPDPALVLVDREDGGNLIVSPPREVWDRSELTPTELTDWSFLVAATGKAMLDVLPQLEGGCINYWDAGNWNLNYKAPPEGFKTAKVYRKVHLHLLGRSPRATSHSYKWGEAPFFPTYEGRFEWAAAFGLLTNEECQKIVRRTEDVLRSVYQLTEAQVEAWRTCVVCEYPTANGRANARAVCAKCKTG